MITCCFAGHRNASYRLMTDIISVIKNLLDISDSIQFYSGGMGDFDKMCEQSVREIKKIYPEKNIRLCWVLPSYQYVPAKMDMEYYRTLYDEIFVCDYSDGVHYKAMISKRNRWIVDQSDIMIAYVLHESGGAYSPLRYAQKQKLRIIRVGTEMK